MTLTSVRTFGVVRTERLRLLADHCSSVRTAVARGKGPLSGHSVFSVDSVSAGAVVRERSDIEERNGAWRKIRRLD